MQTVIFEGPKADLVFFEYLRAEGADVSIVDAEHLDGLGEFVQALIPLKDLIVPVAVAYLVGSRGRSVTIMKNKIVYKGYNLDEIVRTLKDLREGADIDRK